VRLISGHVASVTPAEEGDRCAWPRLPLLPISFITRRGQVVHCHRTVQGSANPAAKPGTVASLSERRPRTTPSTARATSRKRLTPLGAVQREAREEHDRNPAPPAQPRPTARMHGRFDRSSDGVVGAKPLYRVRAGRCRADGVAPSQTASLPRRRQADQSGGASARGYTLRMASRYPRIQVPRDPELDRALARARALLGPDTPSSQVIHDLAVRGAAALEEDHDAQERARNFLVSVADGTSGLDLEALRTVRDRAWR